MGTAMGWIARQRLEEQRPIPSIAGLCFSAISYTWKNQYQSGDHLYEQPRSYDDCSMSAHQHHEWDGSDNKPTMGYMSRA